MNRAAFLPLIILLFPLFTRAQDDPRMDIIFSPQIGIGDGQTTSRYPPSCRFSDIPHRLSLWSWQHQLAHKRRRELPGAPHDRTSSFYLDITTGTSR